MAGKPPGDVVASVRSFNRYYTAVIGALDASHLRSPYTLTEARVLYELAQQARVEVVALRTALGLDAGYLTRILSQFESAGLVTRDRAAHDARRQVVTLTEAGRVEFAGLNRRASRDVEQLLAQLTADDLRQLHESMSTVRALLERAGHGEVVLRAPEPGDLGWIVQRNGALDSAEYGWDASYEALVAGIVAEFAGKHDANRERAWIAEVDGRRVGCVLCVRADEQTAKLRLLLVEPSARGAGVGRRLVEECVAFARSAGYRRMSLWTQSTLVAARKIYAGIGFSMQHSAPHHSFGADLTEETWTLDL